MSERDRALKASTGASKSTGGMNVPEIRDFLRNNGITVSSATKRAELERLLKNFFNSNKSSPSPKAKVKPIAPLSQNTMVQPKPVENTKISIPPRKIKPIKPPTSKDIIAMQNEAYEASLRADMEKDRIRQEALRQKAQRQERQRKQEEESRLEQQRRAAMTREQRAAMFAASYNKKNIKHVRFAEPLVAKPQKTQRLQKIDQGRESMSREQKAAMFAAALDKKKPMISINSKQEHESTMIRPLTAKVRLPKTHTKVLLKLLDKAKSGDNNALSYVLNLKQQHSYKAKPISKLYDQCEQLHDISGDHTVADILKYISNCIGIPDDLTLVSLINGLLSDKAKDKLLSGSNSKLNPKPLGNSEIDKSKPIKIKPLGPIKKIKIKPVKPLSVPTKVVNVMVKYIRPDYTDLEDWDSHPDNVYIGRRGVVFIANMDGTKKRYPPLDSYWANPFKITGNESRQDVIDKYEKHIVAKLNHDGWEKLEELRGKTLGCWCKPEACHGDVLVKLLEKRK